MSLGKNKETNVSKVSHNEAETDKALNDLFFFNESGENTESLLLKQAKRKSYIRIALVSVAVGLLLLVTAALLKIQLTPYMLHNQILKVEQYYELNGANLHIGEWTENYKLWGSSAHAVRYRIVEGIPVYEGEVTVSENDYSRIPSMAKQVDTDWLINQYESEYSLYGSKLMQFLQPGVSYEKEIMDFDQVSQLRDGEAAELGISFERLYSLDEVQEMLPEGVSLIWCWVDTLGEDLQGAVIDGRGLVRNTDDVFGFTVIDDQGNVKENPADDFNDGSGEKIDGGSKRLGGVVVTGSRESLAQLADASYVRAASLGAVVTVR